eukprot:jgi/Psemu1/52967/gm1.52967_g
MTRVWRKQLLKLADTQLTVINGYKPWPKDMFEPLTIALIAPHGKWERQHAWRNGSIRCKACHSMIPKLSRIVCGNFGCRKIGNKWCNGAWHAKCFVQSSGDRFPVLSPRDLDNSVIDESLLEDEDPTRFKKARNRDYLMAPFQCDLCHFVNLKGRCPLSDNHSDQLLLMRIRRAILDSFWSLERSMVQANFSEAKRFVDTFKTFRIKEKAFPHRGPNPQVDSWGIGVACALLVCSLNKGRNPKFVQFETVRRTCSMYANLVHLCASGTGVILMISVATEAPTSNKPWFKHFILGCHQRMGDVWMPDEPVTREILLACLALLDDWWEHYEGDPVKRKFTALRACLCISGFYGGLRGEELNRVDLEGIRKCWNESLRASGDKRHVRLVLSGNFKREVGLKLYMQPLECVTKRNIDICLWFSRALKAYEDEGTLTGPLFRNRSKNKRASVSEMDLGFHEVLLEVQRRTPQLFQENIDVTGAYSTYGSFRRGSTAEAQNAKIGTSSFAFTTAATISSFFIPAATFFPSFHYLDAEASVFTLITSDNCCDLNSPQRLKMSIDLSILTKLI